MRQKTYGLTFDYYATVYIRRYRAEKIQYRRSLFLEALQKMHILPQHEFHLEEPPGTLG